MLRKLLRGSSRTLCISTAYVDADDDEFDLFNTSQEILPLFSTTQRQIQLQVQVSYDETRSTTDVDLSLHDDDDQDFE